MAKAAKADAIEPASNYQQVIMDMTRSLSALAEVQQDIGTQDFVWQIMASVVESESIEDMFAAMEIGLKSSKDFLDTPFELSADGISWRKSTVAGDNGYPYYAVLDIFNLTTGEKETIAAGGMTTVAAIYKMQTAGWLNEPRGFVFKGKVAGNGTVVLIQPFHVRER